MPNASHTAQRHYGKQDNRQEPCGHLDFTVVAEIGVGPERVPS